MSCRCSTRQQQTSAAGAAGTAPPDARHTMRLGGAHRVCSLLTPKIIQIHLNSFQANPFILLFDRRTLARVGLRLRLPGLSSPRSQPSLFPTDLPIPRSAPGFTTGAGSYRASNQAKLGRIPGPISIFRPPPVYSRGPRSDPGMRVYPPGLVAARPASRAHFALGYSVRRLC